jgi:hypothetical protein
MTIWGVTRGSAHTTIHCGKTPLFWCWESDERPSKSDVGLSSNSWHADDFMAVGAILLGSDIYIDFAVCLVGL